MTHPEPTEADYKLIQSMGTKYPTPDKLTVEEVFTLTPTELYEKITTSNSIQAVFIGYNSYPEHEGLAQLFTAFLTLTTEAENAGSNEYEPCENLIGSFLAGAMLERWDNNETITDLIPIVSLKGFQSILNIAVGYEETYTDFIYTDLAYLYARQTLNSTNGHIFIAHEKEYSIALPNLGAALEYVQANRATGLPLSWVFELIGGEL